MPPRLDDVRAYLIALHADTLEKLRGLTPDDLDRVPDPAQPDRNVATQLRHMITHKNNHHGQIDFIRGLQYPEWGSHAGHGSRPALAARPCLTIRSWACSRSKGEGLPKTDHARN